MRCRNFLATAESSNSKRWFFLLHVRKLSSQLLRGEGMENCISKWKVAGLQKRASGFAAEALTLLLQL
eukprot:08799.XXX_2670_2873_1 [CDS] Oithona nana genome sequencing.